MREEGGTLLLAVIAILVGTLVVFASFQGRGTTSPTATNAPGRSAPAAAGAPNVVGKSAADAVAQLLAAGFGLVRYDVDTTTRAAACTVTRQDPAAGAAFSRGSTASISYVPGANCLKG